MQEFRRTPTRTWACKTFNYMHQYQSNLGSNYERIDLKMDLEKVQVPRLHFLYLDHRIP